MNVLHSLKAIASPRTLLLWGLLGSYFGLMQGNLASAQAEIVPPAAYSSDIQQTTQPASEPILLASLANYCEAWESTFLLAETGNFWINICGGHAPYNYVGVNKRTGDAIRLDLSYYSEDGSFFEAVNGAYTYSIVFDTPKGSFLTVTHGNTTILQEYLLDWN